MWSMLHSKMHQAIDHDALIRRWKLYQKRRERKRRVQPRRQSDLQSAWAGDFCKPKLVVGFNASLIYRPGCKVI